MAVIQGFTGDIQIGNTSVGQITNWTYRTDQPPFEYGVLGDINLQALPGPRRATGSVSGYYDPSDTEQEAAIAASEAGTQISLQVYPEGDSASNVEWTGNVSITDMEFTGDHPGLVTFSFSFFGALTRGTV